MSSTKKGTHSMKLRNGRLVNTEDSHISPRGTETRIMAKNLIPGDHFVLNGGKVGKVKKVNVNRRSRGNTNVTFSVTNENRKTFTKVMDGSNKVLIREYPATRFERRRLSRMGHNRPNYKSK